MTCLGCGTPAPGGWAPCVSVDALMRCAASELVFGANDDAEQDVL